MASKEEAHKLDKAGSKPQSAKLAPENSDMLAQQPAYPATLLQPSQLDPKLLSPGNVLQLQRLVGNQAAGRLLAGAAPRPVIQSKLTVGMAHDLPHEAWHVVQQAQGRVKPTMQLKDEAPVNDDEGLEHEAEVMGTKALAYEGWMPEAGPDSEVTQNVSRLKGAIDNQSVQRSSASPSITRSETDGGVIQRTLKPKDLTQYKNQLKAKTTLPIENLVKLIKEKLAAKSDDVTEEHVTQILQALEVAVPKNLSALVSGATAVMSLQTFQERFHNDAGGGVDGYKTAIKGVTNAQDAEIPTFIEALTTGNMFAQHDGSLVRYDLQNASKTTINLQIQLGGKDLYIPKNSAKDKSSVSCVVVDDTIVSICLKSAPIANYVLTEMRTAHTDSYADGNKRVLTLDA